MELPKSWFEDEVRCGFYVSAMMKRSWASKLLILEDLGKVCEKHGIRWFVGSGTLLGAVRHKGFIPWDDDIDVYMFREDLTRLCSVVSDFPPNYLLFSPKMSKNSMLVWFEFSYFLSWQGSGR